jgi:hypothetical protein
MLGKGIALMALVLAVSSCGPNDAPAKCDALVTRLCAREVECLRGATTQEECEAAVKTSLPCAQADGVSDGYESCMSELESSPCSVLVSGYDVNLPATCKGAILFK